VGSELTFTVAPKGTEQRIGIDRDLGAPDRDEIAACSDPTDPQSLSGAFLDVSGGPIVSGEAHTFKLRILARKCVHARLMPGDARGIVKIPAVHLPPEATGAD